MDVKNLYVEVNGESYINVPALYGLNADVYIIFGERSAGKTYSVFKGIFDEYNKNGGQFVYMRTREDYIKGGRARGAVANIKPYVDKTLWKSEADLDYYAGNYRKKEVGRNGKWVYSPVGYTMSIASWMKYKGNGYDNVRTIFLDEFIEDTDTRTIVPLSRNEFLKGWAQNLSTIIRKRDGVRVVCCANSLNPKSPLFYYYNIDARKLDQGKVYIFNREIENTSDKMKICVLYTEPPKNAHVSKHLAVYESQTNDMTIKGMWQEDLYPDTYKGRTWKWYSDNAQKSNHLYIHDHNITIILPSIQGNPMIIVDGKYKSGENTLTAVDLYTSSGLRITQYMLYYKRTKQICSSSPTATERFNDLLRRLIVDKN